MDGDASSSTLCNYSNSSKDTLVLNTVRPALSLLSLVTCLLAIVALFCYKLHRHFNYRLVMYWLSTCMLVSLVLAIHVPMAWYSTSNSALAQYCKFLAFAVFSTSGAMALMATFVTLQVCLLIVRSLSLERYEVPGVVLCFTLPFVLSWIPFVTDSYGFIEFRCGIVTRDENCDIDVAGLVETTVLAKLPACVVASLCSVMLLVAITYFAFKTWKLKYNQRVGPENPGGGRHHPHVDHPEHNLRAYRCDRDCKVVPNEAQGNLDRRHDQYKKALKEILPLIAFAAIYVASSIIGGMTRLIGLTLNSVPLWLALTDSVVQSSVGTFAAVCLVCHLLVQRANSRRKKVRVQGTPEPVQPDRELGVITIAGSITPTCVTVSFEPCDTS